MRVPLLLYSGQVSDRDFRVLFPPQEICDFPGTPGCITERIGG